MLIIERGGINNLGRVINQMVIKAAVSVFPVEEDKVTLHVLLCEYVFILGCYLFV